ncbi:MAG: AAA family ATPase, partial [Granulosicoccus sp.]
VKESGARDTEFKLPSRFVGRYREMRKLESDLHSVEGGSGCARVIVGEAGIGKSRLVHEFVSLPAARTMLQMKWTCSPDFQSSALYPVITGFHDFLLAADESADTDGTTGRAFENLIEHPLENELPSGDIVNALEWLSSGLGDNRIKRGDVISESQKRSVLKGLKQWLIRESQRQPVCLIVEDVHWIDPSTVELLNNILSDLQDNSVLLLATCRDDSVHSVSERFAENREFSELFDASLIQLDKLDNQSCHDLIRSLHGAGQLGDEVLERLVTRSDGIPLFVEESAAMFSNVQASETALATEIQPQSADPVPTRLMELLTVRLHSTGEARHTAGLAASIGREFSSELLIEISELNRETVLQHIDVLLDSGLLRRHAHDRHLLVFKHALVRDAAYASLLKSNRRAYHHRIAKTLEDSHRLPDGAGAELLAYHFTMAEQNETAVDYWLHAGRIARLNSNPSEALSHYDQVGQLLAAGDLSERYPVQRKELQMYLGLGACHIALAGYASDDARHCYEAAERLALETDEPEKSLKAQFGLEVHYMMRANFQKALQYARNCHNQANTMLAGQPSDMDSNNSWKTKLTLAQSSWAMGNVLFHQGDFHASRPLMRECIDLCQGSDTLPHQLAHDPSIMSQLYTAWFDCEAGLLDQALHSVQQTTETARAGGHRYTIGVALAFNACIHFFRNEFKAVQEFATSSIAQSEKPGFTTWLAWARVLRGRALCESGATREEGMEDILSGLELWEKSGAIVTRPFTLALLAECFLLDGRLEQASSHINAARDLIHQFGERYYEAEIYRLSGVILTRQSTDQTDYAVSYFKRAISVASNQGLYRSVLRAAVDLTRLQLANGEIPVALDVLSEARGKIVGGENTSDVMAADAFISQYNAQRISQIDESIQGPVLH